MTRAITTMTIDDALHYTPEQRASIIASYPAHEREARAKGIPTLGSGRIFPIEEDAILVQPFKIPGHWPRINGIDFGWDHPAAAVQGAWDRDNDCWYVVKAHRARVADGWVAEADVAVPRPSPRTSRARRARPSASQAQTAPR